MLIGIIAIIAIWLLVSIIAAGILALMKATVIEEAELEQYGYHIKKVVHLENKVIETKGGKEDEKANC